MEKITFQKPLPLISTSSLLHPCSIESPKYLNNKINSSLFAVGLYELDESTGVRNGGIQLGKYTNRLKDLTFYPIEKINAGVLDLKFSGGKSPFLAAAVSTGELRIYQLPKSFSPESTGLTCVSSSKLEDQGLFLSLDWSNRLYDGEMTSYSSLISVSTQEGSIIIYDFHSSQPIDSDSTFELIEKRLIPNAHSQFGSPMPAWITAFNPHSGGGGGGGGEKDPIKSDPSSSVSFGEEELLDEGYCEEEEEEEDDGSPSTTSSSSTSSLVPNTFLSGGDDCSLKIWDLRTRLSRASSLPTPSVSVPQAHDAGVTSAQWHPSPLHPHLFATGSYDGTVKIWDERAMGGGGGGRGKGRGAIETIETSGGVWRLKWLDPDPTSPLSLPTLSTSSLGSSLLLAGCMHGGAELHRLHFDPIQNEIQSRIREGEYGTSASRKEGLGTTCGVNTVSPLVHMSDPVPSTHEGGQLFYGVDFLKTKEEEEETNHEYDGDPDHSTSSNNSFSIISCSFYDNRIHLWDVPL